MFSFGKQLIKDFALIVGQASGGSDYRFCHHCHTMEEIMAHVLRDYSLAIWTWMHLVHINHMSNFFGMNFQDWLQLNLYTEASRDDLNPWAEL